MAHKSPSAPTVSWLTEPEDHDYPAAASYLSLLADPVTVERIVAGLRAVPAATFKAKDILRAAGLDLLPTTNPHVASDLAKVHHGEALSPVLLVRGDLAGGLHAQIADGYHRVCASYHTDENTDIPVRIVERAVVAGSAPVAGGAGGGNALGG